MTTSSLSREHRALLLGAACFIVGLILAFCINPAWLSRFGSLIIVVGVIYGFTDWPDLTEKRLRGRVQEFKIPSELDNLLKDYDAVGSGYAGRITEMAQREHDHRMQLLAKILMYQLRSVEIALICFGTVVNGFGEWLVQVALLATQ
jgi:predicted membrane protein DUF2335